MEWEKLAEQSYSEVRPHLENFSPHELDEFTEFMRHKRDSQTYDLMEYEPVQDRKYFDDIDVYMGYLVENTKLYDSAESIRNHELAHARCAEALGNVTVKFYVRIMRSGIEYGAFTAAYGPARWPNIGFAAVAAAPVNPSRMDMGEIYKSGYKSIDDLAERIHIWNKSDNGLVIPMPGTFEIN